MKNIKSEKDLPTHAHEAVLVFTTSYERHFSSCHIQYLTFESDDDLKSWIKNNMDKDYRLISVTPKHVNVTVSIT